MTCRLSLSLEQWYRGLYHDVATLEQERSDLKELCGEIIATLALERNVKTFEKLPTQWHELVTHWKLRYEEIVGIMVTTADIIQDIQPSLQALTEELKRENQQNDNN